MAVSPPVSGIRSDDLQAIWSIGEDPGTKGFICTARIARAKAKLGEIPGELRCHLPRAVGRSLRNGAAPLDQNHGGGGVRNQGREVVELHKMEGL